MCFVIHENMKDARKQLSDITVFKLVFLTTRKDCYYSAEQRFPYEIGLHYVEDDFRKTDDNTSIYRGLHSFGSLSTAEQHRKMFPNCIILECIIPKDALYFYNPDHDTFVSDNLIIYRRVNKGKPVRYSELYKQSDFDAVEWIY